MHCHFSVRGFAFVHTCLQLYLYACIVYTHNNIRTHIIQKYMKMYNTLSHLPLVHPFFMFPFYTYFRQDHLLFLTMYHPAPHLTPPRLTPPRLTPLPLTPLPLTPPRLTPPHLILHFLTCKGFTFP